jgi:ankyrin repeat protein
MSLVKMFSLLKTPLHVAACFNDTDALAIYIGAGCDVDVLNEDNISALYLAVVQGHVESVQILIDSGCHIQTDEDDDHLSVVSAAAAYGRDEVCTILTAAIAATKIKKNKLTNYVPQQSSVRMKVSPHACAFHGDLVAMRALYASRRHGFNIPDEEGHTPIFFAVMNGHTAMVEFLIDTGCDKNVVDKLGRTPVAHACINGHRGMVMLLMTTGSNMTTADKNGLTPIDHFTSYLARTHNMTPDEVTTDVNKTIPEVRAKIEELLNKKKMTNKKKKNAARQDEVPTTYDDSDDE